MAYWLATLARSILGRRPEIICSRALWDVCIAGLAGRTLGARRESGAFLLGRRGTPAVVERVVFYDDIDPSALDSGIVVIDGRRLGALWTICRESKLAVVADVHVHPGSYRQSPSDQANPVIAEPNHIALILPNFARGSNLPGRIGIHRYLGGRQWRDESQRWFPPFHVGAYVWK